MSGNIVEAFLSLWAPWDDSVLWRWRWRRKHRNIHKWNFMKLLFSHTINVNLNFSRRHCAGRSSCQGRKTQTWWPDYPDTGGQGNHNLPILEYYLPCPNFFYFLFSFTPVTVRVLLSLLDLLKQILDNSPNSQQPLQICFFQNTIW